MAIRSERRLPENRLWPRAAVLLALLVLATACGTGAGDPMPLEVPRGYVPRLEILHEGRLLGFGPFVGYYFKPERPDDLTRLHFVCFNERRFYTRDLPANRRLFEGEAVLTALPAGAGPLPAAARINPVFFPAAPEAWLAGRPAPADEFRHFHSAYDARGPVAVGYWLRHVAVAAFTYDMGGRVGPDSPLFHRVAAGVDRDFPAIVEFDRGPRPGETGGD
jgi:hypothetical protein